MTCYSKRDFLSHRFSRKAFILLCFGFESLREQKDSFFGRDIFCEMNLRGRIYVRCKVIMICNKKKIGSIHPGQSRHR